MNSTLSLDTRYKFNKAVFDYQAFSLTTGTGKGPVAEAFLLKKTTEKREFEIIHCLPGLPVSLPVSKGCQTVVEFAGEEPVLILGKDKFGNAQAVLSKDSVISVTYVPEYRKRRRVEKIKIYSTIKS